MMFVMPKLAVHFNYFSNTTPIIASTIIAQIFDVINNK
jgi:hypothetical protein